jgi:NTE family protein
MLSPILDVFRLRQAFNGILLGRDVVDGLRKDGQFLDAVRRAAVKLPTDRHEPPEDPFGPFDPLAVDTLRGRRVALIASGGSGALASMVGVWRAFEEAEITPATVVVCSGSALYGLPLAAGRSAEEVALFSLGITPEDYVDINWRDLRRGVLRAGRGFAGLIRGEKLEETYRKLVGDMQLRDLPIPCYAPLWNVEENRLEYAGPRTHPDLDVATAMRAAITIPLFLDPVTIDGSSWGDGGIVDIFPVEPVLGIEPVPDAVVGINGFYPRDFAGEPLRDWRSHAMSIIQVAGQVRTAQHVELARVNVARLRRHSDLELIHPVDYDAVRGVGFYTQFLSRHDWPDFMRAGHAAGRQALLALDKRAGGKESKSMRRTRNTPAPTSAPRATASAAKRTRTGDRRRRAARPAEETG